MRMSGMGTRRRRRLDGFARVFVVVVVVGLMYSCMYTFEYRGWPRLWAL